MRKLQHNLVLIRVDQPAEQDNDGVFRAEEWVELPHTGTVEQVGSGINFCKKGDKVFFSRYGSLEFPDDKDLRVCREDQVLAIL